MEKIKVQICLGTTCFVMGAGTLQSASEELTCRFGEQIEVVGRTTLTDYFIIATGTSSRHVFGLANNLAQDMKKAGHRVQVAGDTGDGNWIVVDAGDVIVHLFTSEMREIYNIEGNWKKSE